KASGSEPSQEQQTKDLKELYEEELKKMIEIVPDKEKELWVELKRLYEPDPRDQLWALQKYMHDPLEWRLYDTCGVHHVSTRRGHEISMLVEKDYPLKKGPTTEIRLGLILYRAPYAIKGVLRCHVTILNTLDYLGKFDCKSDDGFFVGYSLNSKAFRVYNIRTRKVEENLHIRFLEDKPIIAGDGPKWLFDIDILTKSMNYVPVVAGTNSNDFVGTEESIGAGNNATLEATHDDETEVDMSNMTNTYPVPSTPNTRIHKDHSLDHVIGDVLSGVQTRRMTNKQGFISVVYEGKTHEDLLLALILLSQ
ncbi:putative ribonuclease H-like domain-containing protein, partial [Tanacetum coccineum]